VAEEVIERAPRGSTVIDLGCGPGTVLRFIRDKRPDLTLIGADIDPTIICIAEEKAAGTNIQFHVASIDEVPFEPQSADIVVSSLMFHHLDEPVKRKALEQIRRILRPNGIFLLCDFSAPKHRWLLPIVSALLAIEHEAPKQLRGQLFTLAREANATIETLQTYYGCISLHRIIFP
jgi:ubiquinone/menaquinone biosynthesis C-methylase UbiE